VSIPPDFVIPRHRITVDEYYRMAELGILAPDARVELIEGEIIDMPPQGSPHAHVVSLLNRRLLQAAGDSAIVRCQSPLHLSNRSEPEPDFAIVEPRGAHYAKAHPTGNDTFLVVEISSTTVSYDRHIKMPLYARHRVPEAWIVDVQAARIRFYRRPTDTGYAEMTESGRPGITPLVALPTMSVNLTEIAAACLL
jgi:Uma2 family endonuclease